MYTYIIVDDESLVRKGTIKKLEPINNTVQCIGEASNGEVALDLIHKLNPDIVITDMNMPIMDGTKLLPIIAKNYPNKCIIIISGYKDFEYTKQAITANAVNYILKPFGKEELQKSVLDAIIMIKNNMAIENKLSSSETEKEHARYNYDLQLLKHLLLGYQTEKNTFTSERLKSINQLHNFILITLHTTKPFDSTVFQILLEENGFDDLALALSHMNNHNLGFIILFMPEQTVISPKHLCLKIIQTIVDTFESQKNPISFGISLTHKDLLELNSAFSESITALNTQTVDHTIPLCFYTHEKKEAQLIEWEKTDELLFRMEAGMIDDTLQLLDVLFDHFTNLHACTLFDVKYFCFQLSNKVKFIMSTYFEPINSNSNSTSIQSILNELFSLDEIKQYYASFFINMSELLKDQNIYSSDNTIEKIKIYINRHYQNNLTVEFISSLFYMNRSYCSHLFKQSTGINFVDYVNNVRIKQAKYLIQNSDKKMYQIAKSVGYDNVKYFYRVFKKHEKITPKQFQQQQKH